MSWDMSKDIECQIRAMDCEYSMQTTIESISVFFFIFLFRLLFFLFIAARAKKTEL